MNYSKFKDIIGCAPNNKTIIGTYDIEVVLDTDRDDCEWDKSWYLMTGLYRIYMTDTSRSLSNLLFDFYREVGRMSLHHKMIDNSKADRYYDKNRLVAPGERLTLVEDMTLDEFAVVQMQYSSKPHMLLPFATITTMKILYPLEKDETKIKKLLEIRNESIIIRRKYLEYIYEANRTSMKVPKRLRTRSGPTIDNFADDSRPKLTGKKAWDAVDSLNEWANELGYTKNKISEPTRKPIEIIMEKMHLFSRGIDFDSNIRRIIRSYSADFEIISTEHFIIKLKKKDDDPKIKIKNYYLKFHKIVNEFVAPMYDKYKNEYNPDIRFKFQCVIEKGIIDFIDSGIYPSTQSINEMMIEYDKQKAQETPIMPKPVGMMSFNERKKILQQIIDDVANRYNIKEYKIGNEYELNDMMNQIVDMYCVNANSHKIDDMVLPFLRSGA